jgi:hypothetical protein
MDPHTIQYLAERTTSELAPGSFIAGLYRFAGLLCRLSVVAGRDGSSHQEDRLLDRLGP